jgi:AAA family ATP:ADP antiporter
MLYMMRHDHIDPLQHMQGAGDFAAYSIRSATVAYLASPGESENIEAARLILDAMVREDGPQGQRTRLEAARLIGSIPDCFGIQLGLLMHDTDSQVVRHAVRAVGKLRKRQFAPLLIERLSDSELRDDAVDAILAFEDSIAGTLRDYLNDGSVSIEIRREIPSILVRIGTAAAMRILAHNLIQGDSILRYRIIVGLNKLSTLHDSVPVDREIVETVMLAEIMGHYRSYQILASANGEPTEALRKSIEQDLERIFRLMKLVSPERDLLAAYHGLQSKDPVSHANALEFLDNTLKPQLRAMLVPLIDSEVTESQRARLADRFLGVKVGSHQEAITALRGSEDPWLQSCALLWESRSKL